MESTGVYWIPLFELLAARGFEVRLVDPRPLRSVPGRKSDVLDCQWIQQLHTCGLLAAAFRPDDQICALRSDLRQRAMRVTYAAHHIQHVQKALEQMNVKLARVVCDVTGVTGQRILRAVLDGERDPRVLARLAPGPALPAGRGDPCPLAGGNVALGAPLRVAAGGGTPRLLPAADRGLRSRDRGVPRRLRRPDRGPHAPRPSRAPPSRTGRLPRSMSAPTSIASRASISPASTASTRPPPPS